MPDYFPCTGRTAQDEQILLFRLSVASNIEADPTRRAGLAMRMVGKLLHLGTTSLDVSVELAPGQANAYDHREFLEHLLFRCGPALQHTKVKSFSSWHVFQALKRFHPGFSSVDIEDPISGLFPSGLAARTETSVVRGRIGWPQLRFFHDSCVLPDVEGRLLTKEIVLPVRGPPRGRPGQDGLRAFRSERGLLPGDGEDRGGESVRGKRKKRGRREGGK